MILILPTIIAPFSVFVVVTVWKRECLTNGAPSSAGLFPVGCYQNPISKQLRYLLCVLSPFGNGWLPCVS
jgi:hypothetical protein